MFRPVEPRIAALGSIGMLNRLEFGERVRRGTSAVVVVDVPADLCADAAAALVSERADLVAFTSCLR